jgi:hypothetical protein
MAREERNITVPVMVRGWEGEGVLVAGLLDSKNISSPKLRVVISYKFFVLHKFIEELGSPTKIHIPVTEQLDPAVIL